MIFVRGNWLGLGMFFVGGIIAGVGGYFLKLGDFKTMVIVGISLILMDLVFRIVNRHSGNWLFGKETGGFFFFIPVWVLGIIVVIINILNQSGVFN